MESKIILTDRVVNKDRRFGSATHYYPCLIDGTPALFTEEQLQVAQERARRNPEDMPEDTSFWDWLFS